jgi:hypothetical protein
MGIVLLYLCMNVYPNVLLNEFMIMFKFQLFLLWES